MQLIEQMLKQQNQSNRLKHIKSDFNNKNNHKQRKSKMFINRKNLKLQFNRYKASNQSSLQVDDLNSQRKVKEKFELLYKRIQQISKQEYHKGRLQRRLMINPSQLVSYKKIKMINCIEGDKIELSCNYPKAKSIPNQKIQKQSKERQIYKQKLVSTQKIHKHHTQQSQSRFKMIIRRTRYKCKLTPLKINQLSNDINNYLSIQKVHLIDSQSIISTSKKGQTQKPNFVSFKYFDLLSPTPVNKKKKFIPPFESYYYRDLIWKAGFANDYIVQQPSQYCFKVKIYVGKGNNSRLVKSILARRFWCSFTDKIEDANFLWSQLKIPEFIKLQKNFKKQITKCPISYIQSSIFNQQQYKKIQKYWKEYFLEECKMKEDMNLRNKALNIKVVKIGQMQNIKIHNHCKNNFLIVNKKALFYTMSKYYKSIGQNIFDNLPVTFHIKNGLEDQQYTQFIKYFYKQNKKAKLQLKDKSPLNVWIVKPGELTNRGNGIIVCLTLQQIKSILKKKDRHPDGTYKTYIVQKYIQKPLLYKKRKFDLRHYMMVATLNGITKGYWYQEGYVRTTSTEYTLKLSNINIHLTNDAVQKYQPQYGKYEKGNKISYQQLNNYIINTNKNVSFWQNIYPKMKKIGIDTLRACGPLIDTQKKLSFQIFGLDFMIDENFSVWLIEVNTNPCLQLSCPLLGQIIPKMLQNAIELCLDPIFPPPLGVIMKSKIFKQKLQELNKFQLVYDERQNISTVINQLQLSLFTNNQMDKDQNDVFDDDGEDWNED